MARETLDLIPTPVKIVVAIYAAAVAVATGDHVRAARQALEATE